MKLIFFLFVAIFSLALIQANRGNHHDHSQDSPFNHKKWCKKYCKELPSMNCGRSEYLLCDSRKTQPEARDFCKEMNGTLVRVENQRVFSYLSSHMRSSQSPMWIRSWEGNSYNACIALYGTGKWGSGAIAST